MRFNTLSDWLAWQEQLHPSTIELGLDRVSQVWSKLQDKSFACPVITVAGTNGKGSSVGMLRSIYMSAGYRVAAYTSPHIWQYNERITIDNGLVNDELICQAFERVDRARADISLTYFEFGTLAALDIFMHSQPDVVILEVGMGGRLDAVNIIDADVSLITSIDIDHQQWLGSDRASIAREKAGILRKDKPGIISGREVPQSLYQAAADRGAKLQSLDVDFHYETEHDNWSWHSGEHHHYGLPRPALSGDHQLQNAAGVVAVIDTLRSSLPVNEAQLRAGLLEVTVAGRFTLRAGDVNVIYDVAHNPAAAIQLASNLARYPHTGRIHAVFSCLADKNINGMVEPLCDQVAHWYLAETGIERSASLAEMQRAVVTCCAGDSVQTARTVKQAYASAQAQAVSGDTILVFGSFYTVAQAGEEGL